MTILGKTLIGAIMGAGVMAFAMASASAEIVCNDTVCWHTHERYTYPPDARVTVHPDHWRWGEREHYTWREHTGRGYWRGDHWVEIER